MNIRVFSIKQLSSLFHYATCTIQYKDCTRDIKYTQERDGVKISTAIIFLRSRLGKKSAQNSAPQRKINFLSLVRQSGEGFFLLFLILWNIRYHRLRFVCCRVASSFFLSRGSKNGPCLSMSVVFFFFFTRCARTWTWARPGRGRSSTGSARWWRSRPRPTRTAGSTGGPGGWWGGWCSRRCR